MLLELKWFDQFTLVCLHVMMDSYFWTKEINETEIIKSLH